VKRYSGVLVAAIALAACAPKKEKAIPVQTAPAVRRDIVIDAEATGVVEPINVVEVKSKASGQITRMPVETGTNVKPGDLLVQIDTRDVQNNYNQADADLRAAEEKLRISTAQKKRADDMFAGRIITAQENETATLDFANAQASVVRARTNLDLAQQRLEDATVRAPITGTVIDKTVSLGQVITSATSSASGGTIILKMADLSQVRVRALVNESDIGNIRAGLTARVTVDAYPDRPFNGMVEKIEPQAVIQQSVTMFPVLVSIENREGLLKPGMNGEVSVLIDQRTNVLAIPNDAIRNPREAAVTAQMLGLNADTVAKQLQEQRQSMGGGMMGGQGQRGGADGPRRTPTESRGEVDLPNRDQQGGGQGPGQMPEVTDKDCAAVTAAFAKKPDARAKLDGLRTRMQSGELDREGMRAESQKIYASLGVDSRIASACRFRERQQGGAPGAGAAASAGASATPGGAQPRGQSQRVTVEPQGEQPAAGSARTRPRSGLVFVKDGESFSPRFVMLGVSNYDYTEVVSGLKDGEQVALLSAAAMQIQRDQANDRFRNMSGGGLPGMSKSGGGVPAGPGGGGRPGGGGGRP
jgi:HlyD family secretion protein